MLAGERLTERFTEFCESLVQAERIDALPLTDEQKRAKKADFFFAGRRIICEIKTLETDTNDKIAKVLLEAGVQLSIGDNAIHTVLAGRPDKQKLYRKCINVMTTSVSDGVDDANRQIRETKRTFGISEADGLLVLLHGRVQVLNPDVILKRVAERLRKKTTVELPAHADLSYVVLFSEGHKFRTTDGRLLAPVIALPNSAVAEHFGVSAFAKVLADGWAKWNGQAMSVIR
jgi:hypothetical protein